MPFDYQSSNWKSIVFIVVIFNRLMNIFLYLVFSTIVNKVIWGKVLLIKTIVEDLQDISEYSIE